MGDRCHLTLYIHGHIATLDALETIHAAMTEYHFNGIDESGEKFREEIASTLGNSAAYAEFEIEECNYADISEVETALQLCRVAYQISHEAGGEYPAGNRSWMPKGDTEARFEEVTMSDGAVLRVSEVKTALGAEDPLAAVKALVEQCEFACGATMPKLSAGPEVLEALAIEIATVALKIPVPTKPV